MAAGGMGGSRKGTRGPPPVRVKRVGGAERSDGSTATAAAAGPAPARGTPPGSPMRAPAVLDRTNSEERERDLARQRSREARERMEREGPIGEEEAMAAPPQPQFTSEMSFEALWKAVRSGKEAAVADPGRFDKSQAFPVAVHMGMGGLLLEILLEEGEADEPSYNQLAFSLESVTRFQATEEGFFFETAGEDGELTLHILQSTPVAIHCATEALQVAIRLAVRARQLGGEGRAEDTQESPETSGGALISTESLWKAAALPIQLASSLLGMSIGGDGGLSREPSLERGNARPLTSL